MQRIIVLSLAAASLSAVAANQPLIEDTFEQPLASAWSGKHDKTKRVEPGAGRRGSGALVWEMSATNTGRADCGIMGQMKHQERPR